MLVVVLLWWESLWFWPEKYRYKWCRSCSLVVQFISWCPRWHLICVQVCVMLHWHRTLPSLTLAKRFLSVRNYQIIIYCYIRRKKTERNHLMSMVLSEPSLISIILLSPVRIIYFSDKLLSDKFICFAKSRDSYEHVHINETVFYHFRKKVPHFFWTIRIAIFFSCANFFAHIGKLHFSVSVCTIIYVLSAT